MITPERTIGQLCQRVGCCQLLQQLAFADQVVDIFENTMHLHRSLFFAPQRREHGNPVPVLPGTGQRHTHLGKTALAADGRMPRIKQLLLILCGGICQAGNGSSQLVGIHNLQGSIRVDNPATVYIDTPDIVRDTGQQVLDGSQFPLKVAHLLFKAIVI